MGIDVSSTSPVAASARHPLYWENIGFLVLTHLAGVFGVLYLGLIHFSAWSLGLGLLWLGLCMLSTTGGYHRLFSHRSYQGAWPLRVFYLLFGAASFQSSALRWASDHRAHHAHTDEADDPYNITRGFWWAHVGWLLYRSGPSDYRNARDLQSDPLIRLQDRLYLPVAIAVGMLLPFALGALWGDSWGALFLAGFSRLLVQYHATFSINSVAHSVGRRPYSTHTSARDSFIAALATLGEGYHNFHHRFPSDYRNGIRAHQFDPTKWCVWLFSRVRLARNLKRVAPELIATARRSVCSDS